MQVSHYCGQKLQKVILQVEETFQTKYRCYGFLRVKESQTKTQRGNFDTCLMKTKHDQYKNNKRNVKTETAYLVTTNTET